LSEADAWRKEDETNIPIGGGERNLALNGRRKNLFKVVGRVLLAEEDFMKWI
jgi:hypothetical protein